MEPKMLKNNAASVQLYTCRKCGKTLPQSAFIPVKSILAPDGISSICTDCINEMLKEADYSWETVDKICQLLDIPFIPKKFEELKESNKDDVFAAYARYFQSAEYEKLGWKEYNDKFKELKEKSLLDQELPALRENYYDTLRIRWGSGYLDEDLDYLESLYNGILSTQNVNGMLQADQAQKLCKISLEIDNKIRAGVDFDKLMTSYERVVKTANLTPQNSKSESDFSSTGEIVAWLEKRGFINKWYDGANRDIVDEVIHSMEAFVQRLYTNETGLGEEIKNRIQSLVLSKQMEDEGRNLDNTRFEDPFFDQPEEEDFADRDANLLVEEAFDGQAMGV